MKTDSLNIFNIENCICLPYGQSEYGELAVFVKANNFQ